MKGICKNRWQWELWRDGKLIKTWEHGNIYTAEGYEYFLDAGLLGGTQKTAWYIALMGADHTPAATDTYANSMGTGNYESTDYSESTRPTWTPGSISGQSVDNEASKASFTMSGTDTTIYGTMLVSFATKGDNAESGAVLMAIGKFDNIMTGIQAGDSIKAGETCVLRDLIEVSATYVSATSFTVSGDMTDDFLVGKWIHADCGADGIKYGTITNVSYVSSTTVTIIESVLTSNLAGVAY